ncbi:MAG: helix-turn-helix transcriptional regulator [Anaerolineae bacterium]
MQQTRYRIMKYLQATGEADVETLAKELKLAPVTVRHHLGLLCERNLLETGRRRVGRGRPRHLYRLSPEGGEFLCEGDEYAQLASRLLSAFKEIDTSAASRLFEDMADEVVAPHEERLQGLPIEERLDAAIGLMSQSGYSTRWEPDGDEYVVYQLGCPFTELSEDHTDVCIFDHEVLRRATGGKIRHEKSRRHGDQLCSFRVAVNGRGD